MPSTHRPKINLINPALPSSRFQIQVQILTFTIPRKSHLLSRSSVRERHFSGFQPLFLVQGLQLDHVAGGLLVEVVEKRHWQADEQERELELQEVHVASEFLRIVNETLFWRQSMLAESHLRI